MTNKERLIKDKELLKIFVKNPFKIICGTNAWVCNNWYGDDCYFRQKLINNKSYPCKKILNRWLNLCVQDFEWNSLKELLNEKEESEIKFTNGSKISTIQSENTTRGSRSNYFFPKPPIFNWSEAN